jgi:hypothetical protein
MIQAVHQMATQCSDQRIRIEIHTMAVVVEMVTQLRVEIARLSRKDKCGHLERHR